MNVERRIVNRSVRVGKGTGPTTWAPLRSAVSTIRLADWSRTRWSYALRRMRIFCFVIFSMHLFDDFRDDTCADGQAAFANGELGALFERHRHNQGHGQVNIIARQDHFHT